MSGLRCITIRQPYPSLIAHGIKHWETRSRRTHYRGPVAIHAGLNMREFWRIWDTGHRYTYGPEAGIVQALMPLELDPMLGDDILPTGAVVAVADLTDCLPIVHTTQPRNGQCIVASPDRLVLHGDLSEPCEDISDQLPYGYWTPGNWAWKLENVRPLIGACPTCQGTGMIGLCGATDNSSDGPCVLASGHREHGSPCWGEGDVAADWEPASLCPTCSYCACGFIVATDNVTCRYCGDNPIAGRLQPLPAKGRLGLWKPDSDLRWRLARHLEAALPETTP